MEVSAIPSPPCSDEGPPGKTEAPSQAALAQGKIQRLDYGDSRDAPRVSVIIPTRDGERRGLLPRLLEDLHEQTVQRFEVLLVVGDPRQGRAINRGVKSSKAPIIVTLDDDTQIRTRRLLENLVDALERHPSVGMVGASTVLPENPSWLQRTASRQIPRRLFPVVDRLTD